MSKNLFFENFAKYGYDGGNVHPRLNQPVEFVIVVVNEVEVSVFVISVVHDAYPHHQLLQKLVWHVDWHGRGDMGK